jgi:7-keto-8-aminopelargonate synthetase-like enzyme
MGTLGKALGSAGGYIAGSRALIEYLVNKARSFIFSTAAPPSASAAAQAALRLVETEEGAGLLQKLRTNIESFRAFGLTVSAANSPILPLLVGSEEEALQRADILRERGIFVPAIRYPTVARGKARLRFSVSSSHEPSDIELVKEALKSGAAVTSSPSRRSAPFGTVSLPS